MSLKKFDPRRASAKPPIISQTNSRSKSTLASLCTKLIANSLVKFIANSHAKFIAKPLVKFITNPYVKLIANSLVKLTPNFLVKFIEKPFTKVHALTVFFIVATLSGILLAGIFFAPSQSPQESPSAKSAYELTDKPEFKNDQAFPPTSPTRHASIRSLSNLMHIFNPTKSENEFAKKAYLEKDFEEALAYFRRVQTHLENDPLVLNNIAGALHQLQQYESAEDFYLRALESAGESNLGLLSHSEIYYNLGTHYLEINQYDQAIQAYQVALTFNDRDQESKKNLELAIERRSISQDFRTRTTSQQNKEANDGNQGQGKSARPSGQPLVATNTPSPSKETRERSHLPLQEGASQTSYLGGNDALPQEAKQAKPAENELNNQESISRQRADEILESLEEQISNFQKLNYPTPPPNRSPKSPPW